MSYLNKTWNIHDDCDIRTVGVRTEKNMVLKLNDKGNCSQCNGLVGGEMLE